MPRSMTFVPGETGRKPIRPGLKNDGGTNRQEYGSGFISGK